MLDIKECVEAMSVAFNQKTIHASDLAFAKSTEVAEH